MKTPRQPSGQSGFTLLELVLAVLLMTIIIGMVMGISRSSLALGTAMGTAKIGDKLHTQIKLGLNTNNSSPMSRTSSAGRRQAPQRLMMAHNFRSWSASRHGGVDTLPVISCRW